MSFTAKAIVQKKEVWVDYSTVTYGADYITTQGLAVNKEWSKLTPSLNFVLTIRNELADKIKVGSSYTVTFEED